MTPAPARWRTWPRTSITDCPSGSRSPHTCSSIRPRPRRARMTPAPSAGPRSAGPPPAGTASSPRADRGLGRIPYPLLLGILVALLDLIPVIGSTVGGAIVSLVALTVSLPVAIGTRAFYIAYRLAEDYLIVPRIMGRTVEVPAVVTVVAVLLGGALMGLIGALVAIPAAAALRLLLNEV